MRWEEEAVAAMQALGYVVVAKDGVDDYQGWGVLLGQAGGEWAVLSWSYGSCNYCDAYEDMSGVELSAAFGDLVRGGLNEEEARHLFGSAKGW